MLFMPFLVAIGGFNQFSGDVGSRGLRYLLLRTERANIFFGRFIGTTIYTICVVAILVAVVVLYLGGKVGIYGWGELFIWAGWGILALAIVCVPYVALCSWISASIDSPLASLVVSKLVIGFVPAAALIAGMAWEPGGYLKYLLPWGIQNDLLHPDAGPIVVASAACLGYAVVFLALGYRHFSRRDL